MFGLMEDEDIFSTLTFMKDELRSWLGYHFDMIVHIFAQEFFTQENIFLS
jgi:hypothetical protein